MALIDHPFVNRKFSKNELPVAREFDYEKQFYPRFDPHVVSALLEID